MPVALTEPATRTKIDQFSPITHTSTRSQSLTRNTPNATKMPTTRRSTRSSTGAGAKQQTLSFKHKVTKAIKTGKEGYKSPARAKEYIPEPSPEPATTPTKTKKTPDHDDTEPQPAPTTTTDEQLAAASAAAEQPQTDAELAAAQITDKAIEKYWRGIEDSRTAQAVHKKHGEGLATGEKVLRYFDVSSQYGVRIHLSSPFFHLSVELELINAFLCGSLASGSRASSGGSAHRGSG